MKLYNSIGYLKNQYTCELTKELDALSNLIESKHYEYFYHYILADELCRNKKYLTIRVPGCTVGSIIIDDNDKIVRINIDTNSLIKTYPENINELVKKFIGKVIKF